LAVGWDANLKYQLESSCLFPDGSTMFQIKMEPPSKVPNYEQNEEPRAQDWKFEKHFWSLFVETELDDLVKDVAQLFLDHGGLYLSGPAGVGKTFLIHAILQALHARCPEDNHIISALRHCAAMRVGGQTLQHYLCKYNSAGGAPKAGTIVVVDEISEVQLHTLQQLAQWKLMGVRLIFAGDMDGQFKPIFDQWADVMRVKDLRYSRFLWEMCGGLHVKLTEYRRGTDLQLFKWYTGLYKWADNQDPDVVEQLVQRTRERYPLQDEEIDTYFVMSHKLRIKINHAENLKLAARQERTLFLKSPGEMPGIMMQPQDMHVWEGMDLLCHRRKYAADGPVNGGVYRLYSWDDQTLTVRLNEEYRQNFRTLENDEVEENLPKAPKGYKCIDMSGWHTLTHAEAAKIFRPQHALVYANIQGRTMREKHICLMDTGNAHFTVRHLIVAISRATHGKYVHVPSRDQEAKIRQDADKMAAVRMQRPTTPVPRRPDVTFDSAQEWLEYSQNRGILVEQLYKRPNWRQGLNVAREKNDLRKKLLSMSSEDLAELLVKLDCTPTR